MGIAIQILINIFFILLILIILIGIHEFGHFIAAKWRGVRVDEFAIGMGPKVWSYQGEETLYALRAFPIGGFVKILGEGDDPDEDWDAIKNDPANFQNKKPWERIVILSAGVFMNLMLAVFIYYGFLISTDFEFISPSNEIANYESRFGEEKLQTWTLGYASLAENGGAADAGWPDEGYIKSVDRFDIGTSDEFRDVVQASAGKEVTAEICSDEELTDCAIYTTAISDEGLIGIALPQNYIHLIEYKGLERWFGGFAHSYMMLDVAWDYLGQIFGEAKETGDYSTAANAVSSPIGLYFIVEYIREAGLLGILDLTANLSLTLFIMNLLPIPALDGGRIVLVAIEWVKGSPVNKTFEGWLIKGSFIFLLLFMLAIILKDIIFFDNLRNLFN